MHDPYQTPGSPLGAAAGDGNDGRGKATASLVLGLVAIVGWCIPLVGVPLTITGLVLGIKGLGSSRRGMAIAGITLCTIFLMLSIVNAGIGAYLGATGQIKFLPPQPGAPAPAAP